MVSMQLRLGQRLAQRAVLVQRAEILEATGADWAERIAAEAQRNPFLRVRQPATAAPIPESAALPPDLHAWLGSQIRMAMADPEDRALAFRLLEALEPSGWLDQPLSRLAPGAEEQAAQVLHRLQQMEPAGIFARDLRECLTLQARDRGQLDPAMAAVLDRLDCLASDGPAAVARATGLEEQTVLRCLELIRRMDPKPGAAFAAEDAPLREPDLIAHRTASGWSVELNRSMLPEVRVTPLPDGSPADVRQMHQEALSLAKATGLRGRTLLAVGALVVERQRAFLDEGPAALVALGIGEAADALALHPSTISRTVTGLLMATPRGLVAVRDLFCARLAEGTGALSAPALQALIRETIAAESAHAPLEDGEIVEALARRGIHVARRTVAKHRTLAGLPPAAVRRRAVPSGSTAVVHGWQPVPLGGRS
ncbi:RNA polymerase subunit sigma-54 [Cereibacter sphaeroides]|nr:RNA polymerase subunit sigma-54 [Cereibacter sphaeroides]AZB68336.1 RNA polymerase sigma-54 factor [Cereibacter sphaeroides]